MKTKEEDSVADYSTKHYKLKIVQQTFYQSKTLGVVLIAILILKLKS